MIYQKHWVIIRIKRPRYGNIRFGLETVEEKYTCWLPVVNKNGYGFTHVWYSTETKNIVATILGLEPQSFNILKINEEKNVTLTVPKKKEVA